MKARLPANFSPQSFALTAKAKASTAKTNQNPKAKD